ncbi:MAG: DUF2339 domain-containing protein [Verrucomicrobia bacterium]|nr:DUF2339 domain-containing protein [Verrucomicrobiota bacterium]
MEPIIVLILLGLFVVIFVLPVVAMVRSGRAAQDIERLTARIRGLESELARLQRDQLRQPPPTGPHEAPAAPAPTAGPMPAAAPAARSLAATLLEAQDRDLDRSTQTPAPDTPTIEPILGPPPVLAESPPASEPPKPSPPRIEPSPLPEPAFSLAKLKGTLNWEQFMGAKLFAWIGGFALFLGVAYFVKYSFDHNLIPPEVQVALGFLAGIGLVVGGVMMRQKAYTITSHTLCATGVVSLYAVTFACRAVYHFPFFGPTPTFALMALITAAAFILAVRFPAQVVALLGMLGGFLTPILLSTGQDAPVALFSYIALLDAGLLAAALHRRWFYLAPLAAAGTILMQIGWAAQFFVREEYFLGNKVFIPLAVLLGFNALWLGATRWARRGEGEEHFVSGSSLALAAVAFAFTFYFIGFESLGARPWLMFGFAFGVDAAVFLLTRMDRRLGAAQPLSGAAMFLLLGVWLSTRVSNELLPAALVFTLVFAAFHSVVPLALLRLDGVQGAPPKWTLLFAPLALLVLLIPIFKFTELTVLVWPVILLVDILAVALAALAASAVPVMAVLALTLAAAAGVLFKIPAELTGLPLLLIVLGACAVFFTAVGVWLQRKRPLPSPEAAPSISPDAELAAHIPAFAIVLPFALLVILTGRLPLTNPSPVFGLALLLVGMLLGVTCLFRFEWLPVIGLGCVAALEYAWHLRLFDAGAPLTPLLWYLAFFALFAVFPFGFSRRFAESTGPWIAAALAGPAQFFLVHRLVKAAWPNHVMGLLGAVFAIPALVSLLAILKLMATDSPVRRTQLALFGGVGLFFITLIFPLQFDRQWLTVAWGLEGAALCWLFHRLPHPGLRLTGVALLAIAFVRLSLNPAVLSYHAHSETPILNWYLYTYGLVTVSLFAGARLLAPPRDRVLTVNAPALLCTLGAMLAFLLVNIQIADFFTEPGAKTLTFKFSGNFGRDMTYSIAWALFALVLLVVGLIREIAAARYAALGLLGVTVLKLFFHDLAKLAQLYRIGALIGVAVIAIVASFLYQRFTASVAQADESKTVPPAGP